MNGVKEGGTFWFENVQTINLGPNGINKVLIYKSTLLLSTKYELEF
jgi:hypothetical protein